MHRGENDHLLGSHDVYFIVRVFLQCGSLDEVNLREVLKLLPCLHLQIFLVEYDDGMDLFQVLCSQWLHKVEQIFHHAADYDMLVRQL